MSSADLDYARYDCLQESEPPRAGGGGGGGTRGKDLTCGWPDEPGAYLALCRQKQRIL